MMPTRLPLFESAFLPILLIAVFGLTGCYTQIAALEPLNGGLTRVEADYEDDGDVVVRKFYEDGTVDQDYYSEGYDWYMHEPFTYRRYFSSFYDAGYGVDYYGGCGYFNYCDPYFGNHFSMSVGFGYGGWGYSRFGFGYSSFGYSPWGWGGSYYSPWGYASYPSYAYYPPYYGGGSVGTVRGTRGTYGPRGSTMTRDALAGSGSGSGDLRGGRGNTTTVGGSRSTLGSFSDRQVVSVGSSGSTLGKDVDRRTTRSTLSNGRTTESTRARTYGRTSTTRSRATSTSGSTRTRTYDTGRTTRTRSYGTSSSTRSRTSEGAARSTRTRSSDAGRSAAPPRARTDSGASRSSGAARSSGSSGASRSSGATRSSSGGGSRSSSSGTTSKRSGRNNN